MKVAENVFDCVFKNDCVFVAGTYIPKKEVTVLETIKATVIRENQAIRLRARKEGVDRGGVRRVTGNTQYSLLWVYLQAVSMVVLCKL